MELIAYLIWLAVVGLVVGALARLVVPGKHSIGLLGTALIGIAGTFLGGMIFWGLVDNPGEHPIIGFLIAVATAALLVYFIAGRGRRKLRF
jgi:uncharacterized membrane protein YeaQ/YmgE (transglycosylase-associated protein family)